MTYERYIGLDWKVSGLTHTQHTDGCWFLTQYYNCIHSPTIGFWVTFSSDNDHYTQPSITQSALRNYFGKKKKKKMAKKKKNGKKKKKKVKSKMQQSEIIQWT